MTKSVFFILLAFSFAANAQNPITVTEKIMAIDGSSRNCLTVLIEGGSTDEVKRAWKKELKDLKGKVSDRKVLFGDDCSLKGMGDNTFDVYAMVQQASGSVQLAVAFDLGGAHLSTANHPGKYPAAEKLLYDFAVDQAKQVVRGQIGATDKQLDAAEKALAGMQKDKTELEKDIAEYKEKIAKAQADIATNSTEQVAKQQAIEALKNNLKTLETKLGAIR